MESMRRGGRSERLVVDTRTRRVLLDGSELYVTRLEFDVLAMLDSDRGACIRSRDLLDNVFAADDGFGYIGTGKTLSVHIDNLRAKLRDHRWITNVRGVGYRLEVPSPS